MNRKWIVLLTLVPVYLAGCRDNEPTTMPSLSEWTDGQVFTRTKLYQALDHGAVRAEVWVPQVQPRESKVGDAYGTVVVIAEGSRHPKEGTDEPVRHWRRLPSEVHHPKTGGTYRIGMYHLCDPRGRVIDSLEP